MNTITCFACNESEHSSIYLNRKILYTQEATLVGCTNLNLIEVQLDIYDASSIYSLISIKDMEEFPSTSDYTQVNSFASKPYGIAKNICSLSDHISIWLVDMEEQLELLQNDNLDLMFSEWFDEVSLIT